ncbi:MAG TPA: hypothetical protein PKZ95_02285, partial [Syntrophorhabdaceae bacterium]|nr:hypothetical protein [Syntrophorhabdaceae bacterium]HQI55690.1 hypothetical protein [Syntrophorhabdaceae bacterium]
PGTSWTINYSSNQKGEGFEDSRIQEFEWRKIEGWRVGGLAKKPDNGTFRTKINEVFNFGY